MKEADSMIFHSSPCLPLLGTPPHLEKNSFFFRQKMIFLMTDSVLIAFHKDL